MRNAYQQAVARVLDEARVPYEVKPGRHKKAEFFGTDGRRYMVTYSSTHSDYRAVKNAMAQLKKLLREAGYLAKRAASV